MKTPPPLYDAVALHALRLQGFKSRRLSTTRGRMHVLEARGSGRLPPIVLLHGFSSAGVHFHPILPQLKKLSRRVIVPDLLAHGFSDVPRRGIDVREMERSLIEVLDLVIDEPVAMFGLSMGGAAAVRYAVARPERIRGLMLCSPGGAAMEASELAALRESFRIDDHDDALAFVDRVFAKKTLMRQAYAWGVRKSFERPVMRELISGLRTEHLLDPAELSSLRVPVRLVWGAADRVLPDACREFFRRHLPEHTHFDEPASFGHSPFLDDPAGLVRRIEDFLEHLVTRPLLERVGKPASPAPGLAATAPSVQAKTVVDPGAVREELPIRRAS